MIKKWNAILICSLALVLSLNARVESKITPYDLRCEYLENPLGIDSHQPRLSWKLDSGERAQIQSAYQIQAFSSTENLRDGNADLWDSGKVESNQTLHIFYDGKPLQSSMRVYWRVKVWDGAGVETESTPAWWETGLMQPEDWQAKWISRDDPPMLDPLDHFAANPNPLLRKEFAVNKTIRRARAYISGLGYYELYLNGERVGDQMLDPAWTVYRKRVFYSTFDVTDRLRSGGNALGIMLGNGWYNPLPMKMFGKFNMREALSIGEPRAILQLRIDYDDGSTERIATDETWKTGQGPILRNNTYLGEIYDARLEKVDWLQPDFDDSRWSAAVVNDTPIGQLQAQFIPPIRITKEISPLKISEPTEGIYVFDMGQNFAGTVRLRVQGPAGTAVRIRYGELIYPNGMLNGMTAVYGQIKKGVLNAGPGAPETAYQEDTYILKGDGVEEYTPRFTYRGFRYVELTGFPGKPDYNTLTGLRMNTDVEPAGHFECSNELFNRIQGLIDWTFLSNLYSVQSDCPHREKLGYGGDIVASSEMAMYNFDMATVYPKIVRDFGDDVRPNGGFTETAPYVGIADRGLGEGSGPVGWGTAHPLLLWQLYQYYGNKQLIEEQYEAAQNWMKLLARYADEHDGIIDVEISDHESVAPRPVELSATAFLYYNAVLMQRLAAILSKEEDEREYAELSGKIKDTFNRRFLKPDSGVYDIGSQACQSFTLYMGINPPEITDKVFQVLVDDLENKTKGALTTGIFGTKYMLLTLSERGHSDLAYRIVNHKDYPGWAFMLENGATTLWESWKRDENYLSHNHPMFGTVSEWFFKYVGGIQPAPDAVAFDRIVIRPQTQDDVAWARTSYDSIRGPIRTEWRREGNRLNLKVSVPANTIAQVYIPASGASQVIESGVPVSEANSVRLMKDDENEIMYEIGSGIYNFEVNELSNR